MRRHLNGFVLVQPLVFIALAVLASGGVGFYLYEKRVSDQERVKKEEIAHAADQEKIAKLEESLRLLQEEKSATTSQNDALSDIQKQLEEIRAREKAPSVPASAPKVTPPPAVPKTTQTEQALAKGPSVSLPKLIEMTKSGVVAIDSRAGRGTGILVGNASILTNEHVVTDVYRVDIALSNGSVIKGYVAARDKENDLALIVAPEAIGTILRFGDSGEELLKQGDAVYSFGFPFSLGGEVSFKEGTVSRRIDFKSRTYIEMSNAIQPGFSGGPLVNGSGEIVGINTAVYGYFGTNGAVQGESIKLSIPANQARKISDAFIARAHMPTDLRKEEIDKYEKFMTEIDSITAGYDDAISRYDAVLDKGFVHEMGWLHEDMQVLNSRASALMNDIPTVKFSATLRDMNYALVQLTEDASDIFENDATIYLKNRSMNEANAASMKAGLDKRWNMNAKKVDNFNLLYGKTNTEANLFLTYY